MSSNLKIDGAFTGTPGLTPRTHVSGAARELAELQEKIASDLRTLSRLQQEIDDAQCLLRAAQSVNLIEINERLMSKMLKMTVEATTAARTTILPHQGDGPPAEPTPDQPTIT